MRKRRILYIGQNQELASALFPASRYELFLEKTASISRQKMNDDFDLVMIYGALPDESPLQLANEVSAIHQVPVILAVPSDIYDQACYQSSEHRVFVMSIPVQKNMAMQAISMIEKFIDQTRILERQIQKEQQKLKDEKMISQCKLKLIENYHWSEEKAHSFIGKKAMDHSTTRVNIARVLLNRLQASA